MASSAAVRIGQGGPELVRTLAEAALPIALLWEDSRDANRDGEMDWAALRPVLWSLGTWNSPGRNPSGNDRHCCAAAAGMRGPTAGVARSIAGVHCLMPALLAEHTMR